MGNIDYKDGFKFKMLPHRLNEPKQNKKPTLYFVNSMSDLFHEKMDYNFLDSILKVIKETPQHKYQILTKRPQRMRKYFLKNEIPKFGYSNAPINLIIFKKIISPIFVVNLHSHYR